MTAYEQQIESGKEIMRGMLAKVATSLHEPRVNELTFRLTDGDFDRDCVSLVDPRFNVVAKIERDDLADCPADDSVRRRLENQLQRTIQAFHERQSMS